MRVEVKVIVDVIPHEGPAEPEGDEHRIRIAVIAVREAMYSACRAESMEVRIGDDENSIALQGVEAIGLSD